MELISKAPEDTIRIGKKISGGLGPSDILCLFGNLGSGKTVLVKGIAEGLDIEKGKIISPSFVLLRAYPSEKMPLYHFDLYRLKDAGDILGIGYEEYLYGDGVSVIEWADRLGQLLPKEFLKIELSVKGYCARLIRLKGIGRRYEELLANIDENIRP